MKFKTSAIAMAVAGTVAAPMAQADGDVYASARVGAHMIDNNSSQSGGDTFIQSYGSRFGAVGETDLGNGLTGFGRYEVAVNNSGAFDGGRKAYVGVKGDWGALQLGKDYQIFYQYVVGPLDNPWAGSGYAMVDYVGRRPNMVRYNGTVGAISWGVGLEMNPGKDSSDGTPEDVGPPVVAATAGNSDENTEDLDAYEIGGSVSFGDMTLGLAVRDVQTDDDDPDPIFGVALSGIALGDASIGISGMVQEDDYGVVLDVGFMGFYGHIEAADFDKDSDTAASGDGVARADTSPIAYTVGYTLGLGRNTSAWFEYMHVDNDNSDFNDQDHVRAVLKYDIL